MKLIPEKLYGENCVILASTVFDWSTRVTDRRTDGRTDGIAMTYTRYTIYAVARKNIGECYSVNGHVRDNTSQMMWSIALLWVYLAIAANFLYRRQELSLTFHF